MLYVNPLTTGSAGRAAPAVMEQTKRKAAMQELEHFFANLMLREMRKTVPPDSLFGGSNEMTTYYELLDDALGAEMAKAGQLGVASALEEQLRIDDMQKQLRGALDAAQNADTGGSRIGSYVPINNEGHGHNAWPLWEVLE